MDIMRSDIEPLDVCWNILQSGCALTLMVLIRHARLALMCPGRGSGGPDPTLPLLHPPPPRHSDLQG